jgi:hypothetical protein
VNRTDEPELRVIQNLWQVHPMDWIHSVLDKYLISHHEEHESVSVFLNDWNRNHQKGDTYHLLANYEQSFSLISLDHIHGWNWEKTCENAD